MAIKAIFFDMDGVLVFSEPLHFRAWVDLLCRKNIECPDFFKQEKYAGVSDNVIAFELVKKLNLNEAPDILLEEKQQVFLDILSFTELEAPTGCDNFLRDCHSKYKTALVSSSSKKEVEAILRKEKLDGIFDVVITGDDVDKHKPSPEPYLLALKKTGVASEEAFAIEDSSSGIVSAQEAGIKTAIFRGCFNMIEESV